MSRGRSPAPIVDRICARVAVNDRGCWLWQGDCSTNNGYGRIDVGGRGVVVHRAAYEAFIGPIPSGMKVLHECDIPACCNPMHLFLGTLSDNMQDCVAKGRLTRARGEMNKKAKLTQAAVKDLRSRAGFTGCVSAWAREFDVSRRAIRCVLIGLTWKDGGEQQ